MKTDTFTQIKGYEGLYSINTNGEIYSIESEYKNGCLLKPFFVKNYATVKLSKGERIDRKQLQIHRLVATTFTPNPYNKPQVNHIDGNKLNNNVENLEWVTARENQTHQIQLNKNNTSIYTGVSWNKQRQKWSTQISYNGTILQLGFFDNELIASNEYRKKCVELNIENQYARYADLEELFYL